MNDPYKLLSRDGVFACVNSGEGFKSYFDSILEDCSYVYAIKGGPGTGKSGLMKKIAQSAASRGEETLKIYCSSDPDSLDGVILKERKIALVDATAPHVYEPKYPGVTGEIVNLGALWDGDVLRDSRDTVLRCNMLKSAAYSRAFDGLRAAKNLKNAQISLITNDVRQSAFDKAVRRIAADAEREKSGGSALPHQTAGIGMSGWIRLDTDLRKAERVITLLPCFGGENLFLSAVLRRLNDVRVHISFDPVSLLPDSLYLPDTRLLLRIGQPLEDARERVVSIGRYFPLSLEERQLLKKRETALCDCMLCAECELQTVKKHHFALEEIYKGAMRFDLLDEFTERLSERVLSPVI